MSLSQFAPSKFVTRKRATWALTASFLIISIAQPTAQGLDFPTTTRLNLPEGPAAKITSPKMLTSTRLWPLQSQRWPWWPRWLVRLSSLASRPVQSMLPAPSCSPSTHGAMISTAASIASGLKRATGTTRLITLALEHMEFRRRFLPPRWMSSEPIGAQIQ